MTDIRRSGGVTALTRRYLLQAGAAWAALAALPRQLLAARADSAFAAGSAQDVLQALYGTQRLQPTTRVVLDLPDSAENGAVVPVTVRTDLEGVQSITLIVRKNPSPLAVSFEVGADTDAEISTRIKLTDSSSVLAVVKTRDQVYGIEKSVAVKLGACVG
jgi:sulfur-oxidizing protein SoxY